MPDQFLNVIQRSREVSLLTAERNRFSMIKVSGEKLFELVHDCPFADSLAVCLTILPFSGGREREAIGVRKAA